MKTVPIYLSLVIPVYNEEGSLSELIGRCLAVGRKINRPFEIVLIDDGSRDRSADMIREAHRQYPQIVGVLLNRNYGQHAAVRAGLAQAKGEVVVTLDADLQNPPEEIPNLLEEITKGCDVVGTIRARRRDSLLRKLPSMLINKAVQKATGVMMHDYGCMLRAYHRTVVDAMLQCHERSTFIPILANMFAHKTAEIEVSHARRENDHSKYSFFKLINLQFDLLTTMTTFPLRFISLLGGGLAVLGFVLSALMLFFRFMYGPEWAAQGVLTAFSILFIFIGVQLLAMGMLGEYIGRIYNDVRARPRYFVREVLARESSREADEYASSNRLATAGIDR